MKVKVFNRSTIGLWVSSEFLRAPSNTTTFVFDTLNRLTQQTDALNHSATFAYSATDRLTSTTDRDLRLRTLSYDALDRETGETWKNSSGTTVNTQTFTYDAASNEITAADGNGTYTMAYDVLNRMTSEQEPYSQALTFTYDAATNRATRTDSQSGVATETYDAINRLVSYQYSAGTATMSLYQTWTKRDQLNTQTRYSDLSGTHSVGTTSYGYDNAGRETNLQFKDGSGTNISNFTYSYDPGNRLTAETLAVATLAATTTSYQYDADNQLTQAGTLTYGYDSNGNRNNTGYVTGTENQLTKDGTWTYTYDNEGSLTQKTKGTNLDTWNYGYDNLNRLTSATEINAGATVQQLTFKYDVFGNRLDFEVTIGNTTTATHFAYDGDNAWADLNGSNSLLMRRLYTDATDALFARISSGGTVAWYLTDRLGSVRDIANNSTGASIDHLDYDGFGNVTNETSSTNGDRYKFTAREFDSQTGLQYNRARYYDPKIGRWTSQDPIGFNAGDENLYRYVRNNPTNATDPSGLVIIKLYFAPLREFPNPGNWFKREMAYHVFLLLQDNSKGSSEYGLRYYFRGGPQHYPTPTDPGYGRLIATFGIYNPTSVDWVEDLRSLPSELVLFNTCPWRPYIDLLKTIFRELADLRLEYDALQKNSNAMVGEAVDVFLAALKKPYRKQDNPPVWTPGWKYFLGRINVPAFTDTCNPPPSPMPPRCTSGGNGAW